MYENLIEIQLLDTFDGPIRFLRRYNPGAYMEEPKRSLPNFYYVRGTRLTADIEYVQEPT